MTRDRFIPIRRPDPAPAPRKVGRDWLLVGTWLVIGLALAGFTGLSYLALRYAMGASPQ